MPRDGMEIVGTETPRRRKGAKDLMKPLQSLPPSEICAQITELQKIRRFCIKSQSRCDRSMESLIAQALGYNPEADEKERKAVFRRAGAIRRSVEKGGEGQNANDTPGSSALSAIIPMIPVSALSRSVWDEKRGQCEKEMINLVTQLPVYPWAKAVRGLGELGFAIIVGEAGRSIGEYRTVSALWKRMGLAVINGERQRKKDNKADALVHGYNPKRRAEVWTVGDSLFFGQWRGAKEEANTPAHAIGPYGEEYARRKAHTLPRIEATADLPFENPQKWTPKRCDNDARRVMTKALLRDLWVEWRKH